MWGEIAGIAGGIIGNMSARNESKSANRLRQQALDRLAGIELPKLQDELYNLETPEYVNDLIMQQEQAVDIAPTAMDDISIDPRLQAAQMSALEQIAGRADAGLSEQALNELQQSQRATQGASQAKQQQILQEMQQRGQGGAGAELAARLMASQQAADAAGQQGREIAARSAQEDDTAMQALAQLAGGMRNQEFGEQSDVASARDVLERFKAQNTQGVRSRNVSSQNRAAERNIGERQRIADQSANVRNEMEKRRAGLVDTRYNRELNREGMLSGIDMSNANRQDEAAGRTADMWSGIGTGVGGLIGSFGKTGKSTEDSEIDAAVSGGFSSPFKVR